MIHSGIAYSFKKELLQGIHDFDEDMIGLALYTKHAPLDATVTKIYTTLGEVEAEGYDAGGVVVEAKIVQDGGSVTVQFKDVEWIADITARAGLLFNASKDFRAIAVLDFGMDRKSLDGSFKVRFPTTGITRSLITIA